VHLAIAQALALIHEGHTILQHKHASVEPCGNGPLHERIDPRAERVNGERLIDGIRSDLRTGAHCGEHKEEWEEVAHGEHDVTK